MGIAYLQTPIGVLKIVSDGEAVTELSACESVGESQTDAVTEKTAAELLAYFDGKRTAFDLPLAPQGTDFQKAVWTALQTIPFGHTSTYGAIAKAIGKPTACRAVGTAIGRNPILILTPCHRVIASNGIGGFSAGLPKKRWLLAREGVKEAFFAHNVP